MVEALMNQRRRIERCAVELRMWLRTNLTSKTTPSEPASLNELIASVRITGSRLLNLAWITMVDGNER